MHHLTFTLRIVSIKLSNIFQGFFKITIFLFLWLLAAIKLQAQTTLTIKVADNKNKAISFASVEVVQFTDSTKRLQKVTDSIGITSFSLQRNTQYTIKASSVNYLSANKDVMVLDRSQRINITLLPSAKTVGSVVVTSTRPIMRQEDDKTIVDPENLAASSTNAFEILEKTPGLFVDQDGNVYLNSTTPAIIYINGREQKMSTADIASMLRSLPPNSIASIEILRTPSARYDASGGGGIVNVVLRKGVRVGLTGSATAGLNQGTYGNQFIGLNLNNNNGAFTTSLNFNYTRRNNFDEVKTNRTFSPDSLLSQDAFSTYPTNSYYLGFGAGYQINKKWEINYDGRFALSDAVNTTDNLNLISRISTGDIAVNTNSDVANKVHSFNLTQGISSRYKIDSLGSEWTTDFSYNYSPNNTNQTFNNIYNFPAINPTGGDGAIKTNLNFYSGQTNFIKKLAHKLTVETGLKYTHVDFNNTTDYFNQSGSSRYKDVLRTSAYRYTETINAAYLQLTKNIFGITAKAGTRVENTNMDGNQTVPKDTSFAIHRTDFFPYVYLSKDLMKIATYQLRAYLVYRRTISRPSYQLLNPSLQYVDQFLYQTGNPALRPQFTNNYEANISVNESPIFALGVNDTKDIFTNVVYQADSSKSVAYRTYDNLGNNKEIYFRILGALPPGKKYFLVGGAQYNHNFYQGLYENKPLFFKRGSWSFFTYQTFKVTPTTQLTLNGFVRFNGQLQFYELSTFGSLNFSVNQQLLNKKLVLSLSINDILASNRYDFTINQGSINAYGFRRGDTRRVGLNLRYNFGIRKKEENNMLNIESPEKSN